jgi:hypothetical protein
LTACGPIPPRQRAREAPPATEQYGYGQLAVKVTVRAETASPDVSVPVIQTAEQYSE